MRAIGILLFWLGIEAAAAAAQVCAAGSVPHLVIDTARGALVVQLDEKAAPQAVARLVRLAEGPIFDPQIFAGQAEPPRIGYYDGLAFTWTRPHFEIATGVRPPGELIEIEHEIDAEALGLDRRFLGSSAEAMNLAQQEIMPTYKARLRSGPMPPRLREWAERLLATGDAAFLVGVSRKEINEALGYVYRRGLESKAVTRGAVLLRPLSPRFSSARLAIALAELPELTGRATVIGRVVEGLELAQAISVGPLEDPGLAQSRYQPVAPVAIDKVRKECRPNNP